MTIFDQALEITRADHLPGPPQGRWTVAALDALPDDGAHYELSEGVLYMTPPPTPEHQSIAGLIFYALMTHVQRAGLGRVYQAPIGVELAPDSAPEPDIVVVLKANLNAIIGDKRIVGVPDLIVEVASPSTAAYDRDAEAGKQGMYARAGVPEYWIVNPITRTVDLLILEGGAYRKLGTYQGDETLPSQIVPALSVAVAEFFA
jgi:Uma2 family endonuclease